MLRPIETRYQGYRFRSRLEARWAVFFDTLGIHWEYELQGFDLGSLGWYLPDFWLPQVHMWAEVKPDKFTEEEVQKCLSLGQYPGYPCLLLIGPPAFRSFNAVGNFSDCGHSCTSLPYMLTTKYVESEHCFFCGDAYDERDFENDRRYIDAVYAARSARFEHGESPR